MTALALLPAAANSETIGPGLAGFLAIFAVALATVLLLRSMVGHLRKVRYSPDPAAQTRQDPAEPAESSPETVRSSPAETDTSSPQAGENPPGRQA